MIDPLVKANFILHRSFPYLPKKTLGYWNMLTFVFVIYEHYYRQYYYELFDKTRDHEGKNIQYPGKKETNTYFN